MAIGYYRYPQIDYVKTGRNLKRLCRNHGLTVREIQQALGLGSNQAIYDWFNGKSLPALNNFYALSQLLHTPMEEMIFEIFQPRPQESETEHIELVYRCSNRDYERAADYDQRMKEAS